MYHAPALATEVRRMPGMYCMHAKILKRLLNSFVPGKNNRKPEILGDICNFFSLIFMSQIPRRIWMVVDQDVIQGSGFNLTVGCGQIRIRFFLGGRKKFNRVRNHYNYIDFGIKRKGKGEFD